MARSKMPRELEQIALDPQVSIPASEAWLYQNPKTLAAVRRGLQEAAEGKTAAIGSFAQHADEDDREMTARPLP
jgi:hypothetical protein